MDKPIYVVMYHTESGDRGVVGYFNKKPTDGTLSAYFKELMPDEFIDGCRYVFWEVWELEEEKLPKAIKPIPTI